MDAERIRRVRAARGYAKLSQTKLGKRIGVSKDTIRRIEGDNRNWRPLEDESNVLKKIARAAELPAEFFWMDFATGEVSEGATDAGPQDGRLRHGEDAQTSEQTRSPAKSEREDSRRKRS